MGDEFEFGVKSSTLMADKPAQRTADKKDSGQEKAVAQTVIPLSGH